MKKLFKNSFNTAFVRNRLKRNDRHRKRRKSKIQGGRYQENYTAPVNVFKPILHSGRDLRLFDNLQQCLTFFRELRGSNYLNKVGNRKYIVISLKEVQYIDYGFISILTAVVHDLRFRGIQVTGDLPNNPLAKQYIIDSGFLNNLYDKRGKKFKENKSSEMVFFEQGVGELSLEDNKTISKSIKKVVKYLTGQELQFLPIKTIILEICGNSIEYGNTIKRQWLLGIKYEKNRVIFTVTDVGIGILSTLHRKFSTRFKEAFSKTNHEILFGAFCQKYGSSTKEINRNKGLPVVKNTFDENKILNLKVMSNNVILHFDEEDKSMTFPIGSCRFKGTFYQWEIDVNCLTDILKK